MNINAPQAKIMGFDYLYTYQEFVLAHPEVVKQIRLRTRGYFEKVQDAYGQVSTECLRIYKENNIDIRHFNAKSQHERIPVKRKAVEMQCSNCAQKDERIAKLVKESAEKDERIAKFEREIEDLNTLLEECGIIIRNRK